MLNRASQYPGEDEVCYPPLSNLEVVGNPEWRNIPVVSDVVTFAFCALVRTFIAKQSDGMTSYDDVPRPPRNPRMRSVGAQRRDLGSSGLPR